MCVFCFSLGIMVIDGNVAKCLLLLSIHIGSLFRVTGSSRTIAMSFNEVKQARKGLVQREVGVGVVGFESRNPIGRVKILNIPISGAESACYLIKVWVCFSTAVEHMGIRPLPHPPYTLTQFLH